MISSAMGGLFSTTVIKYDFLEDRRSIDYIQNSRVLLFLPGCEELSKRVKEVYPKAKFFAPTKSDPLVTKVEEWMKSASNSSAELVVVNDPSFTTVEKLDPFAKLAISFKFLQLYAHEKKKENFIPLFYGWFFNLQDSGENLRKHGDRLIDELGGKDEFVNEFSKFAMDVPPKDPFDILNYFSTKTLIVGETLLHCTAYYTGYKLTPDTRDYNERNLESFGKAFDMEVIGFLVTPRTFGVRLKLTDEALKFWHEDAQNTTEGQSDWKPSKYSPTSGPGSRAHLTLAVREQVSAVQTGLDLEAIVKLEIEDQKTGRKRLTLNLEKGDARCYDEGLWAFYLNEYQPFKAMLSNFYMEI